jgi:hypothetical protein
LQGALKQFERRADKDGGKQVSQLSRLDESASNIAQSLGISVATLELDLGIVAPQTASKPTPVPVILDRSA